MSWRLPFRFALALLLSACAHLLGLYLTDQPAARRNGAAQPMTVTLLHTPSKQSAPAELAPLALPSPRLSEVSPPPPLPPILSAPPSQAPTGAVAELASPAADQEASWPDWLAVFGQDEDSVFYPANELDVRAAPLTLIEPAMPAELPSDIQSGRVELELRINEYGIVSDIRVVAADPPGWFDLAAIRSFEQARWQPAVRQGRFVKSLKRIEVCFGECILSLPATTEPE